MFIYKNGIFCYAAFLLFSVNFVYSDRIGENEKTITFLAKELRSLHRRVETKISNLQNEINIQKDLEGNYGHFETRRLYRKFMEILYLLVSSSMMVSVDELLEDGGSLINSKVPAKFSIVWIFFIDVRNSAISSDSF
jgi:hypothetical protein